MNADPGHPIYIGSRLELFVDPLLIQRMSGAEMRLNRPVSQETVLVTDRPWEGNASAFCSVFQDEGRYRLYYRGLQIHVGDNGIEEHRPEVACYAESDDGINWVRPELGLIEFNGSKKNNIVWDGEERFGVHGLAIFKDTNPSAAGDARYKAWGVGANPEYDGPPKQPGAKGLFPLKSPDGLHWSLMQDKPCIAAGRFDSHNIAFWDEFRGEYRSYHRNFLESEPYAGREDLTGSGVRGSRAQRDILTAASADFLNWEPSAYLTYGWGKADHLYTNAVTPYFRAPHILLGFPMRYVDRGWSEAIEDLPELEHRRKRAKGNERCGSAVTDGMFMSSRDGRHFHLWPESFIRPGLRPAGNWTYADNLPACGIVATRSRIEGAPDEISLYAAEGYWRGDSLNIRRYTLRMDGFVSIQARLSGGELITRPLVFSGHELTLNFSASAAGSLAVEILQDEEELPVEGYRLTDCRWVLGDDLNRRVVWKGGPDVSRLAGIPIRLRFVLKDADLFAFRFQ